LIGSILVSLLTDKSQLDFDSLLGSTCLHAKRVAEIYMTFLVEISRLNFLHVIDEM